jgi:hypothetical protein
MAKLAGKGKISCFFLRADACDGHETYWANTDMLRGGEQAGYLGLFTVVAAIVAVTESVRFAVMGSTSYILSAQIRGVLEGRTHLVTLSTLEKGR